MAGSSQQPNTNPVGYPANLPTIAVMRITCLAANTPYQGPPMLVPDGFALVIKSSPDNALGGRIYVAGNGADCINPNSAWPLVQNEAVAYYIQDARNLWVSSDTALNWVLFTVEKADGS
jgi:hypothetical protein